MTGLECKGVKRKHYEAEVVLMKKKTASLASVLAVSLQSMSTETGTQQEVPPYEMVKQMTL
jgi:hypothetical protein